MINNKNRMAITLGDPSGIGPEVIIKAINNLYPNKKDLPIIVGDYKTLEKTALDLKIDFEFEIIEKIENYDNKTNSIKVLDNKKYSNINFPTGKNSIDSGKASHEWVEIATDLALSKKVDAICTARKFLDLKI